MRKAIYYPTADTEILVFYVYLVKLIAESLAAKYGTSAETVAKLRDFAERIEASLKQAKADMEKAQSSVRAKDAVFSEAREEMMRELQRMTHLSNFDEADAELMGIRRIKGKQDPNTAVPVISSITVLPDQIIFDWVKSSFQGISIEGSYDGITWVEIGRDFRSPYEDTRRNRQAGQPEARYYRFRYLLNDKGVGLYSAVTKVTAEIN
jgi:hypothetical protein